MWGEEGVDNNQKPQNPPQKTHLVNDSAEFDTPEISNLKWWVRNVANTSPPKYSNARARLTAKNDPGTYIYFSKGTKKVLVFIATPPNPTRGSCWFLRAIQVRRC